MPLVELEGDTASSQAGKHGAPPAGENKHAVTVDTWQMQRRRPSVGCDPFSDSMGWGAPVEGVDPARMGQP